MKFVYEKPTKEIILSNGESDGYETEEIEFEVSDDDFIDCIYELYYKKECDKQTFIFMVKEFDIDLTSIDYADWFDENEIIEILYYDYYLKGNKNG